MNHLESSFWFDHSGVNLERTQFTVKYTFDDLVEVKWKLSDLDIEILYTSLQAHSPVFQLPLILSSDGTGIYITRFVFKKS